MFKVVSVYGVNKPIVGVFNEVDTTTGEVTNHITVLRTADNDYCFQPLKALSFKTANKLKRFLNAIL